MILLTGANGVVGEPMREQLASQATPHKSVSRTRRGDIVWDLSQRLKLEQKARLSGCTSLIHCAPIWLLPQHIEELHELGIGRAVVFSSTSVLSKSESQDSQEQKLVASLSTAEQTLNEACMRLSIELTILRPSMIYGYGNDQNVMQIAGFIKRFGFFVLAGKGIGLRQPVHADDLATAALTSLERPATYGRTYNLAGGETLSYRAMVTRIFSGLNRPVRIVAIPLPLFRACLKIASYFGRFDYTPEMANRMSQDLNYDYSAAEQEIDFMPQKFLLKPQRDLVLDSPVKRQQG